MAKRIHKKVQSTVGVPGSVFKPEQSEGYVKMLLEANNGNRAKAMSDYLFNLEWEGRKLQVRRAGLDVETTARESSEWDDATNAVYSAQLFDEKRILNGEDLPIIERGLKEFDDAKPSLQEKAKSYHDVYLGLRQRLFPELYQS